MSVYSMATQGAGRHAGGAPVAPSASAPPAAAASSSALGGVAPELGKALDSIGTYIPTEVMATYLAILAVIPPAPGRPYQWLMFWAFLAATPIVVWLGVSAAHPGQGLSLPVFEIRLLPWLSIFAASLAFAVFAIGVPGSVVSYVSWYESWMSTAIIILSAFVLSQVNRVARALGPQAPGLDFGSRHLTVSPMSFSRFGGPRDVAQPVMPHNCHREYSYG